MLDFTRTALKPGQLVFVTQDDVTLTGNLTNITSTRLAIGGREFAPNEHLRVERDGDPIWDGAINGFLVGALLGPTLGAKGCLSRPMWHCVVDGGASFAVIGALIDAAHHGRTKVFDGRAKAVKHARWTLQPRIDAHTKGLALAKQFR